MKKKLLKFWCKNLYPFCDIKKTVTDFEIDKAGEYQKMNISLSEHLHNKSKRERNIESLKRKGGNKRYLINWVALAALYGVVVFEIIEPQTFWQKIPFVVTNFIFASVVAILLILYFMIDRETGTDNE